MGKAKSIVITVLLALAVAVAAFFAAVSFPVNNGVKRLNSIASNVPLSAEFSGYAYTRLSPEGVITSEDYTYLKDSEKSSYQKCGSMYVNTDEHDDVAALKADVEKDAAALNARLGEKGYSSYSVAVEDGVCVKLSVPTNFSYAAYKSYDEEARSTALSVAQYALYYMSAYGNLTLRTTQKTINDSDSGKNFICTEDEWSATALVDSAKTYSVAGNDDVSEYFKSIKAAKVGSYSSINFNLTEKGREKIKQITTWISITDSQNLYFFVGDKQMVNFSCKSVIDQNTLSLQSQDFASAQNLAIAMNSAVTGGALALNYQAMDPIATSTATHGENAALFAFIGCLVAFAGLVVLLVIKYKKLGALTSFIAFIMALVEVYAAMLLNIQISVGVLIGATLLLGLYVISSAIVYGEVKRLTESGRTVQASVKEAYKNVIMTVSDIHIVLVVAAILLAAICTGAVAGLGLLAVIGVTASYVLYWFTRFMWYATSSTAKDKFAFAGLNRVVYEDD